MTALLTSATCCPMPGHRSVRTPDRLSIDPTSVTARRRDVGRCRAVPHRLDPATCHLPGRCVGVSNRSTLHNNWCAPASECPCQARSWGWEVNGSPLTFGGSAHDTNPTDACRTSILPRSMAPIAPRCCPSRAQPQHTSGRAEVASRVSGILHDNRGLEAVKSLFYSTGRAKYPPVLPFRLPRGISC